MAGSDGYREPNGSAERSRTQDNVPGVSDQVVGAGVATPVKIRFLLAPSFFLIIPLPTPRIFSKSSRQDAQPSHGFDPRKRRKRRESGWTIPRSTGAQTRKSLEFVGK